MMSETRKNEGGRERDTVLAFLTTPEPLAPVLTSKPHCMMLSVWS
jgi:hypothetical protein